MTVLDAQRLARLALGLRIAVDHTDNGWTITQWGLSDSGWRQDRVIAQHPNWDEALKQAVGNRRKPWTTPCTMLQQ